MQLSKNFHLREFVQSQTALRRGIDNTPPSAVVAALRMLCLMVLEPLRDAVGRPIVITSGYRSPELNRAIGGAKKSQHMLGEAADFEAPGVSNLELVNTIILGHLPYDQLILEFHDPAKGPSSGWVHCSHRSARQRGQVLHALREDGRTVYRSGLGKDEAPNGGEI